MNINPEIFKAYDIRGIYNQDFDDSFAYKLGLAYAELRKKELNRVDNIKIVVACDMRISSPTLKEKLIQGLLDSGCKVFDIGLASTPTFYFAVAHLNSDGGIIVSASHNPAEYNGFKITRQKAIPLSGETGMKDLQKTILSNNLNKAESKGQLTKINNILEKQIEHDLRYAKTKNIDKFKIVIDTANSMGALYFDELFKHLPQCEIIKMNWKLDGTFPAHEADPFKEENIKDLKERVITENADLGITTDGDGDRIFFVDNKGDAVEPGILRAILSKIFLREFPGAKIAYDIRPGKITSDTILENGGQEIITRVGHSLIKEQAIKEGAVFAGESSGHFFLNMGENGCYEVPLIVTTKILEELSQEKKKFSEIILPYKKYFHSGEINSKVSDPDRKIKEIKKIYSNTKQNELDGITIEYPDFWFNIRKSNTEPLLRLNLEAKTKEIMENKKNELLNIIRS